MCSLKDDEYSTTYADEPQNEHGVEEEEAPEEEEVGVEEQQEEDGAGGSRAFDKDEVSTDPNT